MDVTDLSSATLPSWSSGLMEGGTLTGATGWKAAVGCKDAHASFVRNFS
jgi:hypothetical protein